MLQRKDKELAQFQPVVVPKPTAVPKEVKTVPNYFAPPRAVCVKEDVFKTLSAEIVAFAGWVRAQTANERGLRDKIIHEISTAVTEVSVDLELKSYGSYATNMCLPSSDVDLVILSRSGKQCEDSARLLELIRGALAKRAWLRLANVIPAASMPVMKVACEFEGAEVKIDVTVHDSRHKGLECVRLVKDCVRAYPQLEPLLLLFKYMIKLAELNDPYTAISIVANY